MFNQITHNFSNFIDLNFFTQIATLKITTSLQFTNFIRKNPVILFITK